MPRAGLDADAVVTAAAELADTEGLQALTLARLADRLGVRSPSLYAHLDGLDDLLGRLATRGAGQLAASLQAAGVGRSGADALRAVAMAYRAYAREHPGSYTVLQRPGSFADDSDAARRLVEIVAAVISGYGMRDDELIHATRIVRAALHGFVMLEVEGGFRMPLDLDETFARLIATLDRGLSETT